tara:strand:- start:2191 stop:2460 length:270 start_codon:yes stop_codon:yes gene_type:complete
MKRTSKAKRTRSNSQNISPANDNAPKIANIENLKIRSAKSSTTQRAPGFAVFSNFPELLPILNSELILVGEHLGEFVNSILANDNEPNN